MLSLKVHPWPSVCGCGMPFLSLMTRLEQVHLLKWKAVGGWVTEPDEGLHKEGVTSATLHFIFFFPTLEKPELPPDHAHCWRNIATSGMPSSAGGKGGRWRWCSTDRAAPPSGATPSQSTGNLLASLPPCTVPRHSTPSSCSVLCLRQILTGHDELVAASPYLHVDRLMRLRVAPPGSRVAAFSFKKTAQLRLLSLETELEGQWNYVTGFVIQLCHTLHYEAASCRFLVSQEKFCPRCFHGVV